MNKDLWTTYVKSSQIIPFIGNILPKKNKSFFLSNFSPKKVYLQYNDFAWAKQKRHIKCLTLLFFVCRILRWPLDDPHKWPAMWEALPCRDVTMTCLDLSPYPSKQRYRWRRRRLIRIDDSSVIRWRRYWILVPSNERHGDSYHRPLHCSFTQDNVKE